MAKPNTGFLGESERWQKPGDPDQYGYVIAVCPCCNAETYYFMSAWEKKRNDKWIQSIAINPREREEVVRVRKPRYDRAG